MKWKWFLVAILLEVQQSWRGYTFLAGDLEMEEDAGRKAHLEMEEKIREQLQKAMDDENVRDRVSKCKSADELFEIFQEAGVEYSREEVGQIYDMLEKASLDTEELNEDALNDVAGGWVGAAVAGVGAYWGAMYVIGRVYGSKLRKYTC